MEKSDYSEVKELITSNSNCPTNSPFDGENSVVCGSAQDEAFPKGGHLRSFRKIGAEVGNRNDLKAAFTNQRSEKDPRGWAMVHDVGHGLHFSEAVADMAFVTKNALALRDAHSKESLTAPFKSIQSTSIDKLSADESRANSQNGTLFTARVATQMPSGNMTSHGPINAFSFTSSRGVKAATEAEPCNDDGNFDKDSKVSFEINRAAANRSVVGPLTKSTPSKWDDAEKWLSSGEAVPAKVRSKISPLSALSQTGAQVIPGRKSNANPNPEVDGLDEINGVDDSSGENCFDRGDMSLEKCNTFQSDCTKKKEVPRFAFMPAGKPLPLPPPSATVDRYPLEEVFRCDDSSARAPNEPYSYHNVKPTDLIETHGKIVGKIDGTNDPSALPNSTDTSVFAESDVINMRTVCMRDMGTEMTPIASVEPSCTATPLMATTPNLGSPANSRPSSPGRKKNSTPASTSSTASKAAPKSTETNPILSERDKTRAEILALGTQLGKANIAAWATKEEEEADAAQALKENLEIQEVRKNLLASRAAAWEEAEHAKLIARFKREEAKIQAWENHEKAKAEAEMRRVEVKVERMRSHAHERLMNKLAAARRRAEDLRAKAEALRCEQAAKTATRSEHIRRTGKIPTAFSSHFCG
ncbi:uncharacterized protein [Physcomitrium patens]|uniref:Remorin C-terminal domain-containing protein n=1 Tax=Physcomitrium patens TaxID=3218 RepID=A0A2K1J4R4_PHYPA|nr:uncharacterized protein LOC112294040 isoform X1 [Physcomitrium patens]PNR36519.1 hypothetical protein PHYPA_022370 [Physcomitrium patens]|eukprot:XP_024399905.1 uncharacterized protein LOC112294040 isoform X1 [Physcomitrella patens]